MWRVFARIRKETRGRMQQLDQREQDKRQEDLIGQRKSPLSLRSRLGLGLGILVSGALLFQLGGGFPPPAWLLVWWTLIGGGAPVHFSHVLIQAVILLIAWLLLLLVTLHVVHPPQATSPDEEDVETGGVGTMPSSSLLYEAPTQPGQGLAQATPAYAQMRRQDALMTAAAMTPREGEQSAFRHTASPVAASTLAILDTEKEEGGWTSYSRGKEAGEDVPLHQLFAPPASQISRAATSREQRKADGVSTPLIETPIISNLAHPSPLDSSQVSDEQGHQEVAPALLTLQTDSSRGPAYPLAFQIGVDALPLTAGEGPLHLCGWALCHPGLQHNHDGIEDSLLIVGGRRPKADHPGPFGLIVLSSGQGASEPHQTIKRFTPHVLFEPLLSVLLGADPLDQESVRDLLTDCMQRANTHLHKQHEGQSGATMITLLVLGNTAYIANIGDNRAYLYRPPQQLQGDEEGLFHITGEHASGVDIFAIVLKVDDLLLLCSAGLWKRIQQTTFQHLVEQIALAAPSLLCPALVHTALAGGEYGSISTVVLQGRERTP